MVINLDETFSALADPTRRQIIEMLREGPRRAGELAAAFEASEPAISRHLRVLRRSGFIDEHRIARDARVRMYRLRPEPFIDMQAWLAEVQEYWSEQLEAYRRHVELNYAEPAKRGEVP